MRIITFLFLFICMSLSLSAQDQYKVVAVGFYNLENLFDTTDDPIINDEDFLPTGKRSWTKDKYEEKQANMAYTISKMGKKVCPAGLSILGVAEIENRKVLEDLVKQKAIKDRNYQIIHRNSIDRRGIDVALLYNPKHFKVDTTIMHRVNLFKSNGDTLKTRDIMQVTGQLDGEEVTVLVNHWPSRYGGEKRSAPNRNKAADVARSVIDGIQKENPKAKIILMGDLNDDPTSDSLIKHLRSEGRLSEMNKHKVFNPMWDYYQKGRGSNAYRDGWSLFDQIVVTPSLLNKKQDGFQYYKAIIFNSPHLIQKSGRYRGYPFRTFSFDKYQGGYSDHFPVLIYLVKKV